MPKFHIFVSYFYIFNFFLPFHNLESFGIGNICNIFKKSLMLYLFNQKYKKNVIL